VSTSLVGIYVVNINNKISTKRGPGGARTATLSTLYNSLQSPHRQRRRLGAGRIGTPRNAAHIALRSFHGSFLLVASPCPSPSASHRRIPP
jgi:hypothetical protein